MDMKNLRLLENDKFELGNDKTRVSLHETGWEIDYKGIKTSTF